ncbi:MULTISPECIES: ATP-binding protein [unclassified Pseudomonas]|uniref:ATP-binding protein n=1 Tax=unclassified Pseudomonas TaxID=196821 RepID=UPI000BD02680|nr:MULTISPECIES: ATP-binding protein [unclassified Pseudomonas]PVZ10621.1 PAS domain S-box-containing protein [Pseudomonas sp. URIL14HWK12:I12]PVZ22047.1 PAS domain S-box-containing protein [Pseudomonas sp. URIL14HWK12:I10]PVZ30870.1 PAS domain S-box-containing protein [Pseudomonas sp. URIL14HWK12:I11]SNZ17196.1 Alginate biosynthesis sensor protein KinB [Pseudomonas sp. URIL14HWK12:I9]
MKLSMKLRTRLFLSISALITVALLGLLLGLISVIQIADSQESVMRSNVDTLETGLKLRQKLGDQLVMTMANAPDVAALTKAQGDFQGLLDKAVALPASTVEHVAFAQASQDYQRYLQLYAQALAEGRPVNTDPALTQAFNAVRGNLIAAYRATIDSIGANGQIAHRHALWISGLLGLVGIAVLVVGFLTANRVARRFGEPIESLVKAADQIGKGNYEVVLPLSRAPEMSLLTRRFGSMAKALREHQATNVDELLAGQQRLQAVLDSIDDGLLMIDREGLLEHLNPVAQRQLGWEDDRLGMSLGQALERPDLDEHLRLILCGGSLERALEDLSFEVGGEPRLLACSLTPVTHPSEQILGAVMVLHDVTEQRAFERVRSEFILRASHELRTPVTGMHMAFGLLQERLRFEPASREADLFGTVKDEMQRLMQLINDLLNFSRYQSGQQKLTLAPCNVQALLERAYQRHAPAATAGHIELLMDVPDGLPRVQCDEAQLDRVLDNLLDNAIRHTPEEGHIRLQARRHAERVIISVEDTGEGIAYGQQGRIFEPFVQVGRKKGGAGLGLALCKEILQLHGGRMGVYSRPGQGTQFYMALPI